MGLSVRQFVRQSLQSAVCLAGKGEPVIDFFCVEELALVFLERRLKKIENLMFNKACKTDLLWQNENFEKF